MQMCELHHVAVVQGSPVELAVYSVCSTSGPGAVLGSMPAHTSGVRLAGHCRSVALADSQKVSKIAWAATAAIAVWFALVSFATSAYWSARWMERP
jgi:hypothetical protein